MNNKRRWEDVALRLPPTAAPECNNFFSCSVGTNRKPWGFHHRHPRHPASCRVGMWASVWCLGKEWGRETKLEPEGIHVKKENDGQMQAAGRCSMYACLGGRVFFRAPSITLSDGFCKA